jgi:hypothetical protein
MRTLLLLSLLLAPIAAHAGDSCAEMGDAPKAPKKPPAPKPAPTPAPDCNPHCHCDDPKWDMRNPCDPNPRAATDATAEEMGGKKCAAELEACGECTTRCAARHNCAPAECMVPCRKAQDCMARPAR